VTPTARRSHLTPKARRSRLAITLFLGLAAHGCDRSDEPVDGDTSTGSSTSTGATTTGSEGLGSSGADTSSGVDWACEPTVPGGYPGCGANDPAACGPAPCLQALEVVGGTVCTIIGCMDRCDCPPPPSSGTATVECLEFVVADDTACVLHCGNGEQCPDGMVCSVQSCVWPPE
jgi:hypothetical protein